MAGPKVINPNKDKAKQGELAKLLKSARRPFLWVGLFSLAANLLMLAMPLYTLQVLDRVMSSHNLNTLLMLSIVVVGCLVFFGLFTAVRSAVLGRIGDWLQLTLSARLMKVAIENAALGVPVSASQFQRELANIKNFIIGNGITSLCDAPWSVVFIIVIYMINPVLGFLSLIGAFLLLAFGVIVELSTKKPAQRAHEFNLRNLQFVERPARTRASSSLHRRYMGRDTVI